MTNTLVTIALQSMEDAIAQVHESLDATNTELPANIRQRVYEAEDLLWLVRDMIDIHNIEAAFQNIRA